MALIIKKVHLAGTFEDTLLLIKFSDGVPYLSIQISLVRTLFELLNFKDLLETFHALHLRAYTKFMKESM
jgi:hypothetical protein